MSDYFSDVRQGLGDAVERRAHLRWYSRLRLAHGRPLAIVFAALVIATPAVGAVTNWFSFGKPDATPRIAPGDIFGVVKPGASKLLSLRVSDPQGGPAWGLRLVRTNKGNTCVQLGRIEAGQLGSLGIDDSWNNDHRFHAISPNAAYADDCGNTDAAGHGYGNWAQHGVTAAANPTFDGSGGAQDTGCKLRGWGGPPSWPYCPTGSERIVAYGLLGPDATSFTYRNLSGGLTTQRTVGGVGAYLFVFPYNRRTCDRYDQSTSDCSGEQISGLTPSPYVITAIHYRNGRVCRVSPPARLSSAYKAFNRRVAALPLLRSQKRRYARFDRLWEAFLRDQRMTAVQFGMAMRPTCRAVGWVPFKSRHLTAAMVKTPITLRIFPFGTYACPKHVAPTGRCNYGVMRNGVRYGTRVVPVEWSFMARIAVTSDRSWYGWELDYPRGCGAGGEGSTTHSRIRSGQVLRYSTFVGPKCRGTYRLVVGYMPDAPPGMPLDRGMDALTTGRGGSLLVGRATFTIR
jgi:hypothetical protein